MENLIEKIAPPKLVNGIFKNKKVLLYAGGGLVVLIGGYALFRGRQESVTYGAAAADPVSDDTPSSEDGEGSITENEILKRLEALDRSQADYEDAFRTMGGYLSELMSSQAGGYVQQYQRYEPYSEVQAVEPTLLQKQVDLLMGTPTFTFTPQDYTEGQVGVMAGWAENEMNAFSRGEIGTTKDPIGAGANDLHVTYHSSGYVSFDSKSSGIKTSTPSTPAKGSIAEMLSGSGKGSSSHSNKSVSKITGKSGNVEQQLSGMSSSQKLSTLKKAGLIN